MLLIEHENLAPVLLAEPLEPFLSESRPAIRVGPDERGHVPGIPGIHHGAESLAADVQAPADFLDELDGGQSARSTEWFQRQPLVLQLRSLAGAADATLSHDLPRPEWPGPLMSEGQDLLFGIIATTGDRPTGGLESALPIPTLDCRDVDPEHMGNLMMGEGAIHGPCYTLLGAEEQTRI